MNKEYKIIISFVFNRAGKREMSFSEFYLTLSMDLDWFTPDNAKTFTKNAVDNSLLKEEKNFIKPNFNIEEIKIPIGFSPSETAFQKKDIKEEKIEKKQEVSILNMLVEKIVEKSNLDRKTILRQIKEIEKEKNLSIEIAALLIGKEYKLNFDEIFKKNREMFF